MAFVWPPAAVLELAGNKARAVAAARDAGLPVLASSAPSDSVSELVQAAESMTFQVFVKVVAGGGARGMRRVDDTESLPESTEAASREAASAFGDPTVFLEQGVINPRHIKVQTLSPTTTATWCTCTSGTATRAPAPSSSSWMSVASTCSSR